MPYTDYLMTEIYYLVLFCEDLKLIKDTIKQYKLKL